MMINQCLSTYVLSNPCLPPLHMHNIMHILIGAASYTDARFGQGSGQILLNNINCVGSETSLINCTHDSIGMSGSCTHADDAGVRCRRGKLNTLPC